jgi:predicted dienelactone hydrolase
MDLPKILSALAVLVFIGSSFAQDHNRIDLVRPDAPELAAHGPFDIGARTLEFIDAGRLDIVNAVTGEEISRYDRPFTVEVWYPAALLEGTGPGGEYETVTRDGTTRATIYGQGVRDAAVLNDDAPYPLVILSHGYPGNRFLMSHLGENLASNGYIAVSIDHADSTYSDQAAFGSTLLNRPLDQQFVLDEVARLSEEGSGSFLAGLVDANRTGIVGYSMGGYGVVNLLGGGFTQASADSALAPPNGVLAQRVTGNEAYPGAADERIKAAVLIGPWGMNAGFFDAEGLAGVTTPMLFMAGSNDTTSGYEAGIRGIFTGVVNADRYLLTFENGGHGVAAPIPAPAEVWGTGRFSHYSDPVWDAVRTNNIAQHFTAAFFDAHVRGNEAMLAYLELVERAQDGVWAVDSTGEPADGHSYWRGFPNGTAAGLLMEYLPAAEE